MDSQKIEILLEKYYDAETTLEEEDVLMNYFAQDEDKIPVELQQYRAQFQFFAQAQNEQKLDDKFEKNLEKMFAIKEDAISPNAESKPNVPPPETSNKQKDAQVVQIRRSSLNWMIGIAASLVLVVASFFLGRVSVNDQPIAASNKADTVQKQLNELKNTLAKLNKPSTSASERLQVVKTTAAAFKGETGNDQIIDALVNTLNNDENQNVRLAAANALFVYKDNPKVRNALIVSISHQTDPMLKIAMVNMLLALKDKRVKEPIKRILESDKEIPKKVKEVIENNLKAI